MLKMGAIERHKIAAKKLDAIKDKTFRLIKQNIGKISEYDVQQYILSEFKRQNLATDKDAPIVGINQNTSNPHYSPPKKSKTIKKNNLVLVDIWARLKEKKSPFADITWMAYSNKDIPKQIRKTFGTVIKARDIALDFIRKELKDRNLPKTADIDRIVRDYFGSFGLKRFFIHSTGHSLGFSSCHGKFFNLSKTSKKKLKPEIPFTIEPGLYFKNKFGIRSEIDCYITKDYRLIVTTKIQNKMITIS
jgi:Xaa-Pro aminopeptidase